MGSGLTGPPPGQPAPLRDGEFVSQTHTPSIRFAVAEVGPPSPLYIGRDDQLALEVATTNSTDTVTFNVRLLLPTGDIQPLQYQVTALALGGGGYGRLQVALAEGFLLSISAQASSAGNRGVTFVQAYINRGALTSLSTNASQTLFADYATNLCRPGWPSGRILHPAEGPGNLKTFTIGNPAAGADFTITVTTGSRWRVQGIRATLTTGVAVANRTPTLRLRDSSGNIYFVTGNNNLQAASLAFSYSYGPAVTAAQAGPLDFMAPLPDNTVLGNGFTAVSSTTNIQAADQWSAIQVEVEELFDIL